ncbi:acyl-CoA dehydrogenase family protein [Lentzea albida]|uniref:Two-component flavin-dependent monooxygenase n=1 Tax=Lentzea albida TaxID=65499 RepID=A0A1H9UXC0_9PSEU|nr:acyl-CoA dehydrogenase family protein [Lentzea albida]SES13989.1 two-component flavin-dependent monooxygenase [Lentzea albida]
MSDTGLVPVAEKVGALAAEHAQEADRTRKLAPEVVEAVREAGFARHFVAKSHGGNEGGFAELTQAVMAVGEGCASTAWCASLTALSARYATHLPQLGHDELWGSGADTFVVTAQPPLGKATTASGGHRLSGRWAYVSGVDFADWALVCGMVATGGEPEARFFALPRRDFTVVEGWDNAGMRATSSHNVIVDDVFVPEHLSFLRADFISGKNSTSDLPAHNVPFQAVGGLTFVGPAVGAAYGALTAAINAMSGKKVNTTQGVDLCRASAQIDSARFLVEQNAQVLDERTFTPRLMARCERNAAFTAESLVDAVGTLVRAAGTSGFSENSPLQRFWRDIVSASSHVALRYETAVARTWPAALTGE